MVEMLPIIIYILLIVLIIVAIVLGIKMIITLNKVDVLVEDIQNKVKSLDKVFEIVDFATERMSMISEVVISFITSGFKKIFGSSKKSKNFKKEDEVDE